MTKAMTLLEMLDVVRTFVQQPATQNVWVTAEVQDVQVRGGHCYMEMLQKDDAGRQQARVRGCIWASNYARIARSFYNATGQQFASGLKVMVRVSASFHPVFGISLVINEVNPEFTMGDLLRRRNEILRRLQAEGVLEMNRQLRWPLVPQRIAVVSVALSVGVMVLTLAVMMGFKREVSRKITGFAAHATLTDVRSVRSLSPAPVRRSGELEALIRSADGFVSLTPYAVRGGIVRTDDAVEGILLKGVDGSYDWRTFGEWLVEGELPRVGGSVRTKDILLSRNLARRLMLGVGDRVEMLFVEHGDVPRRDSFKVAGIYASGMDEMDNTVVMTDLRNVQRLSDWGPDLVTGYEIFADGLAASDDFARRLDRALFYDESGLGDNLTVRSVG